MYSQMFCLYIRCSKYSLSIEKAYLKEQSIQSISKVIFRSELSFWIALSLNFWFIYWLSDHITVFGYDFKVQFYFFLNIWVNLSFFFEVTDQYRYELLWKFGGQLNIKHQLTEFLTIGQNRTKCKLNLEIKGKTISIMAELFFSGVGQLLLLCEILIISRFVISPL